MTFVHVFAVILGFIVIVGVTGYVLAEHLDKKYGTG